MTVDKMPDLILLCETWCNTEVCNATLTITGFELVEDLRRDREDTRNGIGGGLVVYVRQGLKILSCDTTNKFNQYCKMLLESGGEKYFIYLVYRPPTSGNENLDLLCDLIGSAEKNSLFIGDFNLPSINWEEGCAGNRELKFLQTVQDKFFTQLVDFPTHVRGNCLDLVLTNMPQKICEVSEQGRLGRSDHVMMLVELVVGGSNLEEQMVRKNWKKANWTRIREELAGTKWPTTSDGASADEAWQMLRDRLEEITEEHVPTCVFKQRKSDWMNGELLRELRRKRRLWKKAKQGIDVAEYEEAEKKVKRMIRNAKRNMEKKLAQDCTKNSKPFYSYIRKKTKCRANIGPLVNNAGATISGEEEMAEELNKYFSEVFTREDVDNVPDLEMLRTRSNLSRSWITSEKVRKKIKELKPHSAAGPDGISPRLLQACVNELALQKVI